MEKKGKIRFLVVGALLSAAVIVATMIKVPIGTITYFNLGEVVVYTAALLFGGLMGGSAGAIGAALGDIINGYLIWAPFTFVIKGLEGLIVGRLAKGEVGKRAFLAIIPGAIVMIGGYGVSVLILTAKLEAVYPEVVTDIIQCGIGALIAVPLARLLRDKVSSLI